MKTTQLAAQVDSQRQCPALSSRDTAPWGLEQDEAPMAVRGEQLQPRPSERAQMRDCTPESAAPPESMPRLRRVDHDAHTMPSLRAQQPISGRYAYIAPPSRRVR